MRCAARSMSAHSSANSSPGRMPGVRRDRDQCAHLAGVVAERVAAVEQQVELGGRRRRIVAAAFAAAHEPTERIEAGQQLFVERDREQSDRHRGHAGRLALRPRDRLAALDRRERPVAERRHDLLGPLRPGVEARRLEAAALWTCSASTAALWTRSGGPAVVALLGAAGWEAGPPSLTALVEWPVRWSVLRRGRCCTFAGAGASPASASLSSRSGLLVSPRPLQ